LEEIKMLEQARKEAALINIVSKAELREKMPAYEGKAVTIVVEAPSSKFLVTMQLMDFAYELLALTKNPSGFRLLLFAADRVDILDKIKQKVAARFGANWKFNVVLLAAGQHQSERVTAKFVATCFHSTNTSARRVPMQVSYGKSKSFERLRFRCTDHNCHLRPKGVRDKIKDGTLTGGDDEIHADHREFLQSMMAGGGEDLSDEELDDGNTADALVQQDLGVPEPDPCVASETPTNTKRPYFFRVFPFAESISYYESVLENRDLGYVGGAACVVILTTSGHPSSWWTVKRSCDQVFVCGEEVGEHSIAHGKDILVKMALQNRVSSLSKAKRLLLTHDDQRFIRGPILRADDQSMSAYEVLAGGEWADGLNKFFPAEALEDYLVKQTRHELGWQMVGLTPATPGRGRGLMSLRHYGHTDVILPLTAAYYDDDALYRAVVGEMGSLYDQTVLIQNVKDSSGEVHNIKAILMGLGQHIRHCGSSRANCTIKFEWAKGFNNGGPKCALFLVSHQKNRAGIAPDSELLLDRGLGSGIEIEELDSTPGKRMRLQVEEMFKKSHLEEGALASQDDPSDPQKTALEEKAKADEDKKNKKTLGEAAAAEKAKVAEEKAKVAEEKRKKKAAEDEAKQLAEEKDKKRVPNASLEASPAKRARAGEGIVDSPGKKDPHWLDISAPKARMFFKKDASGGGLGLQSLEISNKWVPKDFCYRVWKSEAEFIFERASKFAAGDSIMAYEMTDQTKIWCLEPQKLLTLKEYIKKFVPETTSVFGYQPFKQGELPKQLTETKTCAGKLLDVNLVRLHGLSLPNTGATCLVWAVKYEATKKQLTPTGIALINSTKFSLLAGQVQDLSASSA